MAFLYILVRKSGGISKDTLDNVDPIPLFTLDPRIAEPCIRVATSVTIDYVRNRRDLGETSSSHGK